MLPNVCCPETSSYSVEVSGWDRDQIFFVETTNLEWSESSGKHLMLGRKLMNNAIIFVRLLQANGNDRPQPVPYEAISMEGDERRYCYRLNAVRPRPRDI